MMFSNKDKRGLSRTMVNMKICDNSSDFFLSVL